MRCVLFDLDGTLTDPGVGIAAAVSHAVSALGLEPLTAEQHSAFVGPPLQDSFAALGLGAAGCELAVQVYREYYADRGLYENEVYAGIPELLADLGDRGALLAVATSKPTVFASRILDHFGLRRHFAVVSGAELDGSRRHKHEVIAHALGQLGRVDPSAGKAADVLTVADAVMVGDRAQDVTGASAVGLDCIGAGWGYATTGELESAGAAAIAASPPELSRLLRLPPGA